MKIDYEKCLESASSNKDLSLCPRGYCTAKKKYAVYPSAYANGYASQVCEGKMPDAKGKQYASKDNDKNENENKKDKDKSKSVQSDLSRWYKEHWVDVCEKNANGHYKECGRKKAILEKDKYPYCRPSKRITEDTPKTVGELSAKEIKKMCAEKRSLDLSTDGKPTRVSHHFKK